MPRKPAREPTGRPDPRDGAALLADVLAGARAEVAEAEKQARSLGKRFKRDLAFAVRFAERMSVGIARALEPDFRGVLGGEHPSRAVLGMKRLDVSYSTKEAGLGLAVSLKSVHFGEKEGGNSRFTHNMKRNDEELRVEATGHHLRQPYAVLAALLFLPLESTEDGDTSSFAKWVKYLWPLKGRVNPDDPPDRFELVFIALYARDGSALHVYEVGGDAPCPRRGRPRGALTFAQFLDRLRDVYRVRNGLTFRFEGEPLA